MDSKLKYSQIKQYRQQALIQQQGLCLLCREEIDPKEAVLDHCHKTGYIRGVLHRGCNCLLGKIENNLARNRIDDVRLEAILKNVFEYRYKFKDHIHPTYKKKSK